MNIISGETYHIYNQGNNKETIFLTEENYIHFLTLFRKFVFPYSKIFSYCLMPNHFHFLIHATPQSKKQIRIGNIDQCMLSNGFRLFRVITPPTLTKISKEVALCSDKEQKLSVADGDEHYGFTAFHYIHQNPMVAGLVTKMENWPYSSFADYLKLRNGTLCDQELAYKIIGFYIQNFELESYREIDQNLIRKIY